jgi:hypothetical protein
MTVKRVKRNNPNFGGSEPEMEPRDEEDKAAKQSSVGLESKTSFWEVLTA